MGYNGLGLLYKEQERLVQAEARFHLALGMLEERDGIDSVDMAPILNNLASLYKKKKELYAFAEPLYRRALAIRRAWLGNYHPSVAICLNNLANLHHGEGLSELADQRYREALASNEAAKEPAEALTGSILGNWALLAHERGLLDEAKIRYERALVIQQQTMGRNHPILAVTLQGYSSLLMDIGRPLEASHFRIRAALIRARQDLALSEVPTPSADTTRTDE